MNDRSSNGAHFFHFEAVNTGRGTLVVGCQAATEATEPQERGCSTRTAVQSFAGNSRCVLTAHIRTGNSAAVS